ncbi:MAG: plasmid pRiA4b ORF-3 family protein [Methylococcales bacterium]|nr:plasmid pRiA4b ORF-3 family protein [Methylococcales bacterium]
MRVNEMATKQLKSIYQIKISLIGAKPPIWRTVLVPSDLGLGAFHDVIQVAMGWTDSHLHQFFDNEKSYGIPDDDFELETEDEADYKLFQLLQKEKDTLTYEYDFGDSWEHKILLEKILPFDTHTLLPVCIKGKRACPPEDCGGIWGYEELLEIISDTEHPEHEGMLEWLGEDFDPDEFDLEEINEDLAEYCR